MTSTPILLLIFNRPDVTRQVFECIRMAKPTQLFIAADGPRPWRENDAALCDATREIIRAVDWPCEVSTLFRDENLGCGKAVASAITWFFEHVEEGIILEDDCLPHPAFFGFCTDLLEKYRNDEKIMMVGGCNMLAHEHQAKKKYHLSKCPMIWGWATWKSSWELFDHEMSRLPEMIRSGDWKHLSDQRDVSNYWMRCFCRCQKLNCWGYQWVYSILSNGGASANAGINLVENMGFGEDSTHTSSGEAPTLSSVKQVDFDGLPQPDVDAIDAEYDLLVHDLVYDMYFRSRRNPLLRLRKRMRSRYKTWRMMQNYLRHADGGS